MKNGEVSNPRVLFMLPKTVPHSRVSTEHQHFRSTVTEVRTGTVPSHPFPSHHLFQTLHCVHFTTEHFPSPASKLQPPDFPPLSHRCDLTLPVLSGPGAKGQTPLTCLPLLFHSDTAGHVSGLFWNPLFPLLAQAGLPDISSALRLLLSSLPGAVLDKCSTLGTGRVPQAPPLSRMALALTPAVSLTSSILCRASNETSYEHLRLTVPSRESLLTPSYPTKGPAPNGPASKPAEQAAPLW